MSAVPEGRYPAERRLPEGVAPFALISLAAATGAGLLFMVWVAVDASRGYASLLEPNETVVLGFLTVPILTAVAATIPVSAAIIAGLLARRLRSLLARAIVVASVVLTVTSSALVALNPLLDPASWLSVVGFAAIPAVALAVSAVVPWRGGFASRRCESRGPVSRPSLPDRPEMV